MWTRGKPATLAVALAVAGALLVEALAEEKPAPDEELLEFLGSLEIDDEAWDGFVRGADADASSPKERARE